MPIETICQGCSRKLRVPDEFAGRQARCPSCKTVYTVPGTAAPKSDEWRLRTEDGSEYGPVRKAEMDAWVREGRVTDNCQLHRGGWGDWRNAAEVYPDLNQPATAPNPFSDQTTRTQPVSTPRPDPYATTRATRRRARPHRGGAVLAMGIIGLLCCQILSPFAWAMGQSDLGAMDSGRVDDSGRSLTQVGMVLGIIGTIILILWVAGNFLAILGRVF